MADRVRELLTDPELVDLDVLTAMGDVGLEEAREYRLLLPRFHEIRAGLYAAADRAAERVVPKLPYYLDQSFDPIKRRYDPRRGVTQLVRAVSEFAYPSAVDAYAYRNALLQHFAGRLGAMLALQISLAAEKRPHGAELLVEFQSSLFPYEGEASADAAASAVVEWNRGRCFLRKHGAALRALAKHYPAAPHDIARLIQEVNSLSYLRNIDPAEREVHGAYFRIFGDGLDGWEKYRAETAAGLELSFDPAAVASDPTRPWSSYTITETRLRLSLDRSGQLVSGSGLPLSAVLQHAGLGDVSNALHACVLEQLREALLAKPEDRLPATPTPRRIRPVAPPPSPAVTAVDLFSAADNDAITEEPGELPAEEDSSTFVIETRSELGVAEVLPPEVQDALPQRVSSVLLRNLTEDDVIAAFTRLLGKPTRVRGSHHIFKGRNGGTYPAPRHPGKTMGIGLLLKCLDRLGIGAEELLSALR